MTADERWNRLITTALDGLLSMQPEHIESAERSIREGLATIGPMRPESLLRLKLTHGAAVQAAQLFRGFIPQEGYSAMGPSEHEAVGHGLCVTG